MPPLDNAALDEIKGELKNMADGAKAHAAKLHEELSKELKDVRQLAEEAKGGVTDVVLREQIDKITASVAQKHADAERLVKAESDRLDKIETMLKRSPMGGTDGKNDELKEALAFYETKSAVSGTLKIGQRPKADEIDIEGYKSYRDEFEMYLRRDKESVEHKTLSVGSDPDGGYLVPTARSARIIQRVFETSPLRQLATVETIGSGSLEIPIDEQEAGFGWVGEEEARPETSTPRVGTQTIPVFEIYAKPKATQRLLEDAAVNIEAWIAGKIADRFRRAEATAFITGNGVKKPRGILTYPAGSDPTNVARGTILQVASGAATAITADVITKMPFQIKAPYAANANWLMRRATIQDVMLLKDGTGQYLWRQGLQAGAPSILAGYAVQQADDMPAVEAGALPIAFGDFRAGYTVVDRLGITTLRDQYSAKPFVEFYSRRRVGGDVVNFEAFALVKIAAS